MRFLSIVVLLVCCGCCSVSEELYTEDEICSLCCKFCHWHDGGFKSVDMKDSEHFVTGMFRDREFFTPEAFEAYDLQNMTRKLSCGEARGHYAENDGQTIYLYVDLTKQTVEDPDSEDYHYYSFDYIIYNRKNDRISSVSHSSVDYHQLGLARFGCLRE